MCEPGARGVVRTLFRARGADVCTFHIVREPFAGNGRTRRGECCHDALVEASVADCEFRTGTVESSWATATCPGRKGRAQAPHQAALEELRDAVLRGGPLHGVALGGHRALG